MGYKCPLCNSSISRETYDKVSGVEKERQKYQENLKRQLETEKAKILKEKTSLLEKHQREKQKLKQAAEKTKADAFRRLAHARRQEQLKAQVIKNAIERKHLQKEKEMHKKVQNEIYIRTNLSKKLFDKENEIKILQDHLNKGTTPQIEGLLEEKVLLKKLKELFKSDKFQHTGKGGDIIQTVFERNLEIGKIVYECKKVKNFKPEYISQTRKARQDRAADYAVLVTNQFPRKANCYFVEKQVFVISPISVELISQTLRGSLVQMSLLKVDPSLKKLAVQRVYSFLSSNDYSNRIHDFVGQIMELRKELENEVSGHCRSWNKRFKGYLGLYSGVHSLDGKLKDLITIEASSTTLNSVQFPSIPLLENLKS